MTDSRLIYRILSELRSAMSADELDPERISAEAIGTDENRLSALLAMLQESGYIDGVNVRRYKSDKHVTVYPIDPRITLSGLEYLEENSMMRKAARAALGIVDAVS